MGKQLIKNPAKAALFERRVAMACPPKTERRRVQLAKRSGADFLVCPSPESADRNVCATFLEELIDACVLAVSDAQIISEGNKAKPGSLYFPQKAAAKDLLFMDKVSDLLNVDAASSRIAYAKHAAPSTDRSSATKLEASSTIESIETFVVTVNAPSHPIRTQLDRLTADSPDLFAVIKQEGAV